MTEYACVVDGCDYTNEHGSVIAHAIGKKDDQHAGLAYQEVRQELDRRGPIDGTDMETDRQPVDTADPDDETPPDDGADNDMSVFDAPSPDRQPNTGDVDVSDDSFPLKAGQQVVGADGYHYQTEAGDRITPAAESDDAIPLSAGQTVETTTGEKFETEQGDFLE